MVRQIAKVTGASQRTIARDVGEPNGSKSEPSGSDQSRWAAHGVTPRICQPLRRRWHARRPRWVRSRSSPIPANMSFIRVSSWPRFGRVLKARAQELKLLMDHAEQSTGGTVVNVIAYKADYVTATEQLKVLDATARDKKCAIPADL